jgi:DNA-binding NarL/FixJ family response regulator
LNDTQVSLATHFGSRFFERPKGLALPGMREKLYRRMGLGWILLLTERERDLMHYLANGFPASYIAKELAIRPRTVENYMATLKSKLYCDSKLELIHKAKEFVLVEGA